MKLNKLFTIVMAAAVILGFAGCKNDLTLAEKLIDKGDSKDIGKLYFEFNSAYWRFDPETGNILNVWVNPVNLANYNQIYIPDVSYASEIKAILGTEPIASIEKEDSNYNKFKTIIEDSKTGCYEISFIDFTGLYSGIGYKYTTDIKQAFKHKSNPVLPASMTNKLSA